MGRVQIREAAQAALAAGGIPYVGTVFPARPGLVTEQDYEVARSEYAANRLAEASQSEAGSNAVLVVNLVSDRRQRRALTGRGAVNDTRIHECALEVWFACTAGQAVQAQVDYDTIVDAIVELVRDNPTLSAPSTVWSSGEYGAGVEHEQSMPYQGEDGTTVLISGILKFQIWEWVAGPVPA